MEKRTALPLLGALRLAQRPLAHRRAELSRSPGPGDRADPCPVYLLPPPGGTPSAPHRADPGVWRLWLVLLPGSGTGTHCADRRPCPSGSSTATHLPVGGPLSGIGGPQPHRVA